MAVNLKIVSQVVASGTPGPAGKSAYQIAVDNGFEGTESEWLKSGLFPFKGWYDSVSELETAHANPIVGEYAYVKGATSSDPVKIYECSTEGSWSDSGRIVDTSTVQTFRSGEAVNDVGIDDEPTAGSNNLVKSSGCMYPFKGVASPSSTPVNGKNMVYLAATAGTYTNFGDKVLEDGEIAILKKSNNVWYKESLGNYSPYSIYESANNLKTSGFIFIGVTSPTSTPAAINGRIAYIAATAGTYTNFSGRSLVEGEIAVLKRVGDTWYKETIGNYKTSDIREQLNTLFKELFATNVTKSGTSASVVTYPLHAGVKYRFKVNSVGGYISTIKSTETASYSGTTVETFNTASLRTGDSIDFYVGIDASYLCFYNDGACNVTIEPLNTPDCLYKQLGTPDIYSVSGNVSACFSCNIVKGKKYSIFNRGNGYITTIKTVSGNTYSSSTIQLIQDGSLRLASGKYLSFEATENASHIGMWCSDALTVELYEDNTVYGKLHNNIAETNKRIDDVIDEIREEPSVSDYNFDKQSAVASIVSKSPNVYNTTNDNQCLAFSIITDIHSDTTRFKRACAYADDEDGVVATFALGDNIQNTAYANIMLNALNYDKPIIPLVGNHEVMSWGSSIIGWKQADAMAAYYSNDLVTHNGETHPSGKCYWYKDFTVSGQSKKIRVIALYSFESDSEHNDLTYYTQSQIDWLLNLLDGCDSNTYVIVLTHYAVTPNMTKVDCSFTPSDFLGIVHTGGSNTYSNPGNMSDNDFIPKIIQAWIDGGNVNTSCTMANDGAVVSVNHTFANAHAHRFVGYISGHSHYDYISRLTEYSDQLQISLNCTSVQDIQQNSDLGRKTTGKSQDCFTLIGIDWYNNRINLVRIGADITVDMKERKYANIAF